MTTFVIRPNDRNRSQIIANAMELLSKLSALKPWQIVIEPHKKEKSDPQNRALWGLAYGILRHETGQDAEDWHEYMLGEYFGWVEENFFGRKKLRPARTTTTDFDGRPAKLSTEEFARYFEFIQSRAAQNGIHIPDPDPLWREQAAA
jgi:hypothetical protein